ncbi:DUF6042 family protein (plasmid) [Microtetraspora malaysiensis]|uniref:DUF6042 family protein n=1 Tax=Microtetraspora malaysiensis TaxID=161358 RepID=UPI003D8A1A73
MSFSLETFGSVVFGQGWSRWMPASGVVLLGQFASTNAEHPLTFEELTAELSFASRLIEDRGWETEAWEPLEELTDERLAELRETWGDDDDDADAATVNAEEAANREQVKSRIDESARHLGVRQIRTYRDLFDYLVACQLILAHTDDSVTRYSLNLTPPLPGEVFPLTEEEAEEEDRIRWQHLHEGPAGTIIELFEPNGAQHDEIVSSLEKLSKKTAMDAETVREAILHLIAQGDFSATLDISRIERYKVFKLRVDWEKFLNTRIHVRVKRSTT